jgi:hypothetical protein
MAKVYDASKHQLVLLKCQNFCHQNFCYLLFAILNGSKHALIYHITIYNETNMFVIRFIYFFWERGENM